MATVISVENLSKSYQLGQIGTGTFAHDLNVWWAKLHGKPNPMLRIGETDHGNRDGEELWALKNVSFTVQQGEVLGIIGRNGAGKSTLLKILSRVTAPTSGKIKVKGRVASLLEVGTGFHPELTGRENVYLNGAILGMSRREIDRKFDEIVDFAEVEKFIDTPVKRYSSGMYVRLAFAVAAHLDPEILVVDEVLAVGDAEFQKKCLGKMGDVAHEGRTVLFVSHNMGAISTLCSRVLVLENGILFFNGEKDHAIEKYLEEVHGPEDMKIEGIREKIANLRPNPDFQLVDVDLFQSDGSTFYTDKPIIVRISFRVINTLSGLRVGFDLKVSETDMIIFRSFHDDNSFGKHEIQPGFYQCEAVIPSNLLASQTYRIVLLAGIHNVKWLINQGELSWEVHLQNVRGINSNYSDHRPGILLPSISWSIKSLEPQ